MPPLLLERPPQEIDEAVTRNGDQPLGLYAGQTHLVLPAPLPPTTSTFNLVKPFPFQLLFLGIVIFSVSLLAFQLGALLFQKSPKTSCGLACADIGTFTTCQGVKGRWKRIGEPVDSVLLTKDGARFVFTPSKEGSSPHDAGSRSGVVRSGRESVGRRLDCCLSSDVGARRLRRNDRVI